VDKLNLPEIPVSIICFLIAVTQNYIINQKLSFRQNSDENKLSLKKWGAFVSGSLFGLAVNIVVMKLAIAWFELPYKFIAQLAGIFVGMIVNFFISKNLVFRERKSK
jgi:putative flippase GtrA